MEATLLAEIERRTSCNRLATFRPYPKQLEFIAAGVEHRERLLMAGNQLGKSYTGAMEAASHLTGLYADWWPGHRFNRPIRMWAGSDTSETTRDTVQATLIGPPSREDAWGTGAIPKANILAVTRRMGVANAIDTVTIQHVSGGVSTLGFKSYDQGRAKWQGTVQDCVWLDEEPPIDIYSEAMTRTNTVEDGRVWITFTPLRGLSKVVEAFLHDTEAYENPYAMAAE
jgi:phage terminase large subunit-like protein